MPACRTSFFLYGHKSLDIIDRWLLSWIDRAYLSLGFRNLKHILFIMDGNGRWAKKRLLPRTAGHLAGVKRIKEIVDECFLTYQIPYVSLFCFSSENWNRPEAEVSTLFKLLKEFFSSNIEDFKSKGVKIRVVGDLADKRIPTDILNTINEAMKETKELNKYNFTVLFNYGGRQDVVQATKRFASLYKEGKVGLDSLNVDYLLHQDGRMSVELFLYLELQSKLCLLAPSMYSTYGV
uniref:Alkyl transferase n=1 Tax=Junco hyemalis TaxID=40217 RepID=A0A8C5NIM7_JUNHY